MIKFLLIGLATEGVTLGWKGITISWVLLAIVVAMQPHFDPLGTDVSLIVVVPMVGGIAVWQLVKYWLMSPERRAEMRAAALTQAARRR